MSSECLKSPKDMVSCDASPAIPAGAPTVGQVVPCWRSNINPTPGVYSCVCQNPGWTCVSMLVCLVHTIERAEQESKKSQQELLRGYFAQCPPYDGHCVKLTDPMALWAFVEEEPHTRSVEG